MTNSGDTCGMCMGTGYTNHPDSGEICSSCGGSGGSDKPRFRVSAPSVRITWTQYALNYMDPPKHVNQQLPREG